MPIDGASAALVVPFLNFIGRAARTGFELASVPAETKDYLQTISDVVNDLKTARELQRQKADYLTDMDEIRIARAIHSAEEAMKGLQVLIERPRVDMETSFGGVRASSRILWVLRDSTKVQAVLSRLHLANQSLHSEIAMMRNIRGGGSYGCGNDDRCKCYHGSKSPGAAPPSYLQATMDAMNERRLLNKARPSVCTRRRPSQIEHPRSQPRSRLPTVASPQDDEEGVSASISNIADYFRVNEEMIASSAPMLASSELVSRESHSTEISTDEVRSLQFRQREHQPTASSYSHSRSARSHVEEARSTESRLNEPRSLASRLEDLRSVSHRSGGTPSMTSRSESTRLGEYRSVSSPPPVDPPPYAVSSFNRPQTASPPQSQADAAELPRDTFNSRQRRPRPYNFTGSEIPQEARAMSPEGSVSAFLRRTSPPLEIEYPSALENPRTRPRNPFAMSDPGRIDEVLATSYDDTPNSDYNVNRFARSNLTAEHDLGTDADEFGSQMHLRNVAADSTVSATRGGRRPPRLRRRPVSNPENPEFTPDSRPISGRSIREARPSRLDWQVEQQNAAMARLKSLSL